MRWQLGWTCLGLSVALAGCGSDTPETQEEPEVESSAPIEVPLGVATEKEDFGSMGQAVAALASGDIATTWQRGVLLSTAVLVQLLDPRGVPLLGAEGLTLESGELAEPGIVARAGEGFFVGYTRHGGPSYEVVVHRLDGNGSSLWPGGVVAALSATSAEAQSEPFLTADPWGGVYVCFAVTDWSGLDPPYDLRCQHLGEDGRRLWGATGRAVAPRRGWRVLPRAVLDRSGGLLVFWGDYGNINDAEDVPIRIEGQHFSPEGTVLWAPGGLRVRATNLSETNGHSYGFYGVVPDAAGGAILAFNDWTQTADAALDVMAQRVSEDGRLLWGSGVIVAANAGQEQHDATIATCPGCAAIAVWQPGSRLVLYMLGPDGGHLWPSSGVELGSGTGEVYGATGDFSNGVLRVAWTRQLEYASGEFDVRRARFGLDGTRLPGSEEFSNAPGAQVTKGSVFQRATSSFVVAWSDTRASGSLALTDTYLGIQVDRTSLSGPSPDARLASSEPRHVVSAHGDRRLAGLGRANPGGHLVQAALPGLPDR